MTEEVCFIYVLYSVIPFLLLKESDTGEGRGGPLFLICLYLCVLAYLLPSVLRLWKVAVAMRTQGERGGEPCPDYVHTSKYVLCLPPQRGT
jgi:hypothetical protein